MGDTSKRYRPEQIVSMLREAKVELIKGLSIPVVAKKLGITDQTYYRWRKEYGGMKVDHVWAYDFVAGRTYDGRAYKMLTLVDEFTLECLAIDVGRRCLV